MCGESHGEHVCQWLYSHIAMLTEHQAISCSFMFLLCKNHPCQSAISVFDKKKICVHPRHPCSTKRISVFISVIRVRQKENLLYFLHVSFFLFTFAPCLYTLTGKTGYVLLRRRQAYRGAAGISRHYGLMLLQRPSRETNCCRSSEK